MSKFWCSLPLRSPAVRWSRLLAILAPAVYAGYAMVLQLGEISIPSPLWQHLFAVIGAVAVGVSAAARFAVATPSPRSLKSSASAKLAVHHPIGLQKTMLLPE